MKNEMSLDGFGVVELDEREKGNTEGGNPGVLLLMYLIYETLENPVSSKNAFWAGYNSTQK